MSDLTTAERDNIALGQRLECAEARIEELEAALQEISTLWGAGTYAKQIARAALAPETEK